MAIACGRDTDNDGNCGGMWCPFGTPGAVDRKVCLHPIQLPTEEQIYDAVQTAEGNLIKAVYGVHTPDCEFPCKDPHQ